MRTPPMIARIATVLMGLLCAGLVLAPAGTGRVVLAQCPDSYEPNDSFADALPITPETPLDSYICSETDVDYFKFAVTPGQEIILSLTSLPADYDLRLYDPSGGIVEESYRPGLVSEYISHTATVAGEYRAMIYGYGGAFDPLTPYTLRVFVGPCPDPFEPNEDFDGALAIWSAGTFEAYICTETDQDWFKFDVTAGQQITLDLTDLPADYDLYLYHPLTRAEVERSAMADLTPEQIIHTADTTGEYRAAVVPFANVFTPADSYVFTLGLSGGPTPTATSSATATATQPVGSPTPTATPTATSTGPAVRYVATTGDDTNNDCRDSNAPCRTIQRGVDQAGVGEEVRVAGGTYADVSTFEGLNQAVYIDKSLTLHGGYSTGDWSNPSSTLNPTTIDAGGLGRGVVITGPVSITLERLRITGGNAAGLGGGVWTGWDAGGGIYVRNAGGTIRNMEIYGNDAGSGYTSGGGIYLFATSLVLRENLIYSNTVTYHGGGIHSLLGTGRIEKNGIRNNAAGYGAGIFIENSEEVLLENTVVSNVASNSGGGITLMNSHDAELAANRVLANSAGAIGGGLFLQNSDAVMSDNVVIANEVTGPAGFGGGIGLITSDALLINHIVARNECAGLGAGIYVEDGRPDLFHTTVADNTGDEGSGIYVATTGDTTSVYLINSIIAGHAIGLTATAGTSAQLEGTLWYANPNNRLGAGTITHTVDVTGDPRFVDPPAGDYHILIDSSAIDQGVPTSEDRDIDGDPRPMGAGPDLGADEVDASVKFVVDTNRDDANGYDALPGDGLCADPLGECTLRAALEETSAGADGMFHEITFAGPMTITLSSSLPYVERSTAIDASDQWNAANDHPGVALLGSTGLEGIHLLADGCQVYGLYVTGFTSTGEAIRIESAHNIIGGPAAGQRNVFSGNDIGIDITGPDAHHNTVQSNYVGLSPAGDAAEPNDIGIGVYSGASDNLIGGDTPERGNIVSGNSFQGIRIDGEGTDGNRLGGNQVGGTLTNPNSAGNADAGIRIAYGPANTRIGGDGLAPNTVQATEQNGIQISEASAGTIIEANTVRYNGDDGIRIYDTSDCVVSQNTIHANGLAGVRVTGANAQRVRISQNTIWANSYGLSIGNGANGSLQPPVIQLGDAGSISGTAGSISGTACAGCTVEVFSDAGNQGRYYAGETTAEASGAWAFSGSFTESNVTAISIDAAGNTSEFSHPFFTDTKVFLPLIARN